MQIHGLDEMYYQSLVIKYLKMSELDRVADFGKMLAHKLLKNYTKGGEKTK